MKILNIKMWTEKKSLFIIKYIKKAKEIIGGIVNTSLLILSWLLTKEISNQQFLHF